MIDFTTLPRRNKTYAGANGSKIAVMYEDELYMLKFPGIARKNMDMSYANGRLMKLRLSLICKSNSIKQCLRNGRRRFWTALCRISGKRKEATQDNHI